VVEADIIVTIHDADFISIFDGKCLDGLNSLFVLEEA
jgi:hypothetical protein